MTTENQEIYHAMIGLISEFPELRDAFVKKDYVNRLEETGDFLYYSSILMDLLGITELVETLILNWSSSFGSDFNKYLDIARNKLQKSYQEIILDELLDLSDIIKKIVEYKVPINKQQIVACISRIYACLYALEIAETASGPVHDNIRSFFVHCMNINYLKLWLRYGKKFSEVSAINRDIKTEYNALKMSVGNEMVYNAEEMENFYISRQPDAVVNETINKS